METAAVSSKDMEKAVFSGFPAGRLSFMAWKTAILSLSASPASEMVLWADRFIKGHCITKGISRTVFPCLRVF